MLTADYKSWDEKSDIPKVVTSVNIAFSVTSHDLCGKVTSEGSLK